MELTGLDESASRALVNAKERFKDARREATRAFKNEALTTSDRILAMEYRVMATMLETIDNPADALVPCRVCIKEINCLSAVQNSFKVELQKGIMSWFNKVERGKIISSVCKVNRAIFDATRAVGRGEPLWMSPRVGTEEEKIDPLRDERVVDVLREQNMEHCFIASWSFGQEGVEKHGLESPCGMAMNSKGQFIITESDNSKVKVFDRRGQFVNYFSLPFNKVDLLCLDVFNVAVDMNDNFYVLVKLRKRVDQRFESVVYVFNNNGELHNQFHVNWDGYWCTCPPMVVNSKRKVVITCNRFIKQEGCVLVYENDGQFVRRFGEGLWFVTDLALATDDRVIVLDRNSYVHMFSEHGDHLSKFKLSFSRFSTCSIAFHHSSEHVVVADVKGAGYVYLHIYTKDGELVRSTQTHVNGIGPSQRRMIVTAEGDVVLLCAKPGCVFILC